MNCQWRDQVIAYLYGDEEDKAPHIEKHIESCPECAAFVEGYLAKQQQGIDIPSPTSQTRDEKLREKVCKYKKGRGRIIIFIIIGLILGLFSVYYRNIDFIPLRALFGIPYKLAEIIYGIFLPLRENYLASLYAGDMLYSYFTWFGSTKYLLSFFAVFVTPSLIGGAIYGSIGYFTGDKKVFTLSRYLRFALIWLAIIGGYIGLIFLINAIIPGGGAA